MGAGEQRFDAVGRLVAVIGARPADDGGFAEPCSIAVDAAGRMYVADSGK